MVYGFKPQGLNRSIQANTRNSPQDPPPTKRVIKKKPIVQNPVVKIVAPTVKPLTLKQRIITFLKKVMRR